MIRIHDVIYHFGYDQTQWCYLSFMIWSETIMLFIIYDMIRTYDVIYNFGYDQQIKEYESLSIWPEQNEESDALQE